MISASDPTVFLNYASVSYMNNTLDTIVDSIYLDYWIFTVLDYLAFHHRKLHIVNLDIKPLNIFLGERHQNNLFNTLSMDLGSALILDLEEETKYYVQIATE